MPQKKHFSKPFSGLPAKSGDRVPPQAIDAEKAVLGSMLIEREAIEQCHEILQPEHFYSHNHRVIFEAMVDLYNRNSAVDMITLSEELRSKKMIELVGGEVYLAELIDKVSTAAHAGHYAGIVRQKATLRDLINNATHVVEQCYLEEEEPEKLVDLAQERIFAVSQKQEMKGFVHASALSQIVMERIEKANLNKQSVTGVPTGFIKFDNMTGGLQKSDFVILAARPSQGKTAMALNIAYHAAVEKKVPVAIFSLEMGKESIFQRMVCAAAMTDLHQVRTGMFKREKWADLTRELARLSESSLYIDDTPGITITEMRMRSRRLASELRKQGKELGLIMIDYIQLIRSAGRVESRQQEVSEISRMIKDLARTLNVPVMALSQLNRRSEDGGRTGHKPQLSDLRESGSLEQDADVVALIHREGYYERDNPDLQRQASVIIAKQRNGPVGEVELNFLSEFTRFTNPAPQNMDFPEESALAPS
ncbi:MAG: replicative DNA helicase [Elusimicrobiaceae bacterium]|nr:replicative DNA helicase [Elusimicrobiaceae bacterium]